MVSKIQWKPFWLATQLYPQNEWTGRGKMVWTMKYAHRPDCTILGEFPMKPKHVHFQTPFGAVTLCLQWKWRRKGRMEERTEAWAQWAYTDPDELVRRSSDGDMLRPADTSTDAAIPLSRTSSITSSSSTTGQCSSSETQRNAFISHPSNKLHQSETKIEKIQDPLPAVSRRPVFRWYFKIITHSKKRFCEWKTIIKRIVPTDAMIVLQTSKFCFEVWV